MKIRNCLLALMLVLPATEALATGEIERLITPADRTRLGQYDATRKAALDEARKGAPGDVATLDALLARKPIAFGDFDMTGNWQCRAIKVGGPVPVVVYGWFKCRVTDDGSGWYLEKLTGSQRTSGRFFTDSDTRLTYLGALHVGGEKPKRYPAGPDSDQAGYAFRTGHNEWRIELPAPRYESKLDILELRR
jgi:Domain of unknown function (DUF4893)